LNAGRPIFHATFSVCRLLHTNGSSGRPSWPPPLPPPRPRPCWAAAAPSGVSLMAGGTSASTHLAPQLVGRFVSVLTLLLLGPRQVGQSSASRAEPAARVAIVVRLSRARMEVSLRSNQKLVFRPQCY